ncbi:MAG: tryptophan-rich sensory protein [Nocardioides sp.]|uniref:tryptophan-rich sensory protein n=1 Tax=Nocardioides sp. TaxID=35761 RepID=UPI003F0506AC
MTTLVTGATGYVGGKLVPELLRRGHDVRVLTRSAASLTSSDWGDRVEVVEGDATSGSDLDRALAGVRTAYYLLHSMDGHGDFAERDRRMAEGFARATARAGVDQLVYLSGLHPDGELSPHLASRVEVGEIFLRGPVPAAVLQAGVVLGAGSASYEMLRHLTERLPAMVAPKWLKNRIQPVAVDDVVHYLASVPDLPEPVDRTFDVGGPNVLTYAQMLRGYARTAGLWPRLVVTVPVLTPGLASHWVGLVTPVPAGVAKPLVGSLAHDAVCDESDLLELVGPPPGGRTGYEEALRRALTEYDPLDWSRTLRRTAGAVALTAVVGGLATDPGSRWYQALRKPAWQPPAEAFPVVWTALYAGIAVAGAAAQTELPEGRRRFAGALGANLVLNAAWSVVFFRLHRPTAATGVAVALAASSADLARRAAPTGRGKVAGLGAYAAWSGFASVLSGWIARANPEGGRGRAPTSSPRRRRMGA